MIKLNTNENPYPPAPGVLKAMTAPDGDALRRYPDPAASVLVNALAERYQVDPSQVFVGVGSDDVLAMAFMTFFNSEKPILFPDITYSFYPVWAEEFRIPFEKVALKDDFTICKEDYYRENGGIVFPNPNAPTALAMGLKDVEEIIRHNPDVVVIVDEAYVDFGAESALKLVEKYENLLVVQTFSKSRSLAGMRIGFAIGNPVLIKYLNDVKYSFNSYTMDQTALSCGVAAVKDEAYFQETTDKIKKTRIPRQTFYLSPIRSIRRKTCSRRSGMRAFMYAILPSPESIITCGYPSEPTGRWRRSMHSSASTWEKRKAIHTRKEIFIWKH